MRQYVPAVIGTAGTGVTLAHANEIIGAIAGILTVAYMARKCWICARQDLHARALGKRISDNQRANREED